MTLFYRYKLMFAGDRARLAATRYRVEGLRSLARNFLHFECARWVGYGGKIQHGSGSQTMSKIGPIFVVLSLSCCAPSTPPDRSSDNGKAALPISFTDAADYPVPRAHSCHVSMGPFGPTYPPAGTMVMRNDNDGWCRLAMGFHPAGGSHGYIPPLYLTQPPAHGEIKVGSAKDRVQVLYHPAAGFIGMDSFKIRADSIDDIFYIPFRVTVNP
jgi:hypothetical protein